MGSRARTVFLAAGLLGAASAATALDAAGVRWVILPSSSPTGIPASVAAEAGAGPIGATVSNGSKPGLLHSGTATLKGSIKGDNGMVYQLGAAEGQTISVRLEPSNSACYFNVLAPGGGGEAIFIGSTSGNEFSGTLGASGTYGIQVYLMRSAARRNEACNYSLTIEIRGGAAAGAAPTAAKAGSGPVVSRGNMAAHCRGEASSMYGVKPAYIMTGQINAGADGGSTVDGTADQGTNGTKKFQCRFDAASHFVEVTPLDSDGE